MPFCWGFQHVAMAIASLHRGAAIHPFVQPPVVMTGSLPASSTIDRYQQPQLFFAPPVPMLTVVEKEDRRAKKRDRSARRSSSSTSTSQLRRRLKARKSLTEKQAKKFKDQDEGSEKLVEKVVRRRKRGSRLLTALRLWRSSLLCRRCSSFSAPSSREPSDSPARFVLKSTPRFVSRSTIRRSTPHEAASGYRDPQPMRHQRARSIDSKDCRMDSRRSYRSRSRHPPRPLVQDRPSRREAPRQEPGPSDRAFLARVRQQTAELDCEALDGVATSRARENRHL